MSPTDSAARAPGRWPSVDFLRGLVMVIMALDHTRDFVHRGAMLFPPEDLARTTPVIFFTRWITHLCAPTFMFTAGLGAWFRWERSGRESAALSRFLWTRGLWLILLEVTAVRFAFFFNVTYDVTFLLVFWALGLSMIGLAALVRLPYRWLLALSLALIVGHNLLDGIRADAFGGFAWLWQLLHQQGLLIAHPVVIVGYPLVPWIAVMALGFCFGPIYRLPDDQRRRRLVGIGLALTAAFLIVRVANVYGDPRPWAVQSRGAVFTVLSFLNTTKYPASLAFLLMTLGPAMVLLGVMDGARPRDVNPLLVFGRTPLLYFVLHLPLIHLVAVGLTWLRYGTAPFLWTPPPTLGTARDVFPTDYGWSLATAYAVTAVVVVALYPVCLWFGRVKARRRDWWLGYL